MSFVLLGNSFWGWNKNEDTEAVKNIEEKEKITISTNEVKTIETLDKSEEPIKVVQTKVKKATKPKKTEKQIKIEEYESKLEEIKQIEDTKEWFLAYKDLSFKYIKWIYHSETVFDAFTEEEVRLICKAVETECYQQNFDSKVNVASVIFNRIGIGGEYGDSVKEVITKPNQFAYGRDNLSEDTILAVQYAYEIMDTTDGCVAFRSGKLPEKWYSWKLIFVDEAGHGFYK